LAERNGKQKNTMKFFNQEKKRVCYLHEHQHEIVKYFGDNEDATLVVSFDEFILPKKPIDFNKVSEINIKKLMLSGSYHKTNELGAFLKLPTLIELDNRDIELHYDFINFPNLEILRYTWQKKCLNISECKKLKELSLWNYKPKNQNLTEFSKLNSLDELRIIQSNIKSINGIENLQNIKEMVFIANKLLSFDDMNCAFPNVEILHIESCKEIKIEKIIKLFPNIK
jgi:Leucine-rich repeat (LRR) protein